jgi:hypothetical protein
MRENIRDVGRDLIWQGEIYLRGGTLQEVGSANSSELEAGPNGGRKRKEKCIWGFWRWRSTAETPPIEGAGIAFLRKEFTKYAKLLR